MDTYKRSCKARYTDAMNREQALTQAAREVLRTLVKDSPYSSKYIAEKVGEVPSTFSSRLTGNRVGYQNLDTSLVVNVLAVLDVTFVDFATQVEQRAQEILRTQR